MNIESEADRVQSFVDRANYHAALNIALSALNECRRISDQAGVDRFLKIMQGIVETLVDEFGSKA